MDNRTTGCSYSKRVNIFLGTVPTNLPYCHQAVLVVIFLKVISSEAIVPNNTDTIM